MLIFKIHIVGDDWVIYIRDDGCKTSGFKQLELSSAFVLKVEDEAAKKALEIQETDNTYLIYMKECDDIEEKLPRITSKTVIRYSFLSTE
jgi:hypothetical protein